MVPSFSQLQRVCYIVIRRIAQTDTVSCVDPVTKQNNAFTYIGTAIIVVTMPVVPFIVELKWQNLVRTLMRIFVVNKIHSMDSNRENVRYVDTTKAFPSWGSGNMFAE